MAFGWVGVGVAAGVMGMVERCWTAGALGPGHEGAGFGGSPLKTPDFERGAALDPGDWGTGSDGAGGGFRTNPADALIGLMAATVQVAGYTSWNVTGLQICLRKLCHNREKFLIWCDWLSFAGLLNSQLLKSPLL